MLCQSERVVVALTAESTDVVADAIVYLLQLRAGFRCHLPQTDRQTDVYTTVLRCAIFSSSARASAVTCRRQTDRQTCTLQYSAAVVKVNLPYHSNFGPLMSTCCRHCLSRAFFWGGSGFPQGGVSPNLQFPPNNCQLVCSKYCYFRGGGNKLQTYHGQRTSAVTCRTIDSIHFTANGKQVCVQLPTYADNVALPASAHCTCYMQYPSIFGDPAKRLPN